jgi:hypothetical protein
MADAIKGRKKWRGKGRKEDITERNGRKESRKEGSGGEW